MSFTPCTPDCKSEYRCTCGQCQANCVCALGDVARCEQDTDDEPEAEA